MNRRARLVLVVLLVLAALPLLALYTGAGARTLLPVAARLAGVELQYSGGTLGGTVRLNYLRLRGDGLTLDLEDVTLRHDVRCLWRSEICLRELDVGALELVLGGAAADDSPVPQEADFHLPVAVTIESFRLGRARVQWPGGEWSQGETRLALHLSGQAVTVKHASVQGAQLELAGAGPAVEGVRSGERTTLPPIALPLHLRVDSLVLAAPALTLAGETHPLHRLDLAGDWARDRLRLAHLSLESASLGNLELRDGALRFSGDWPLRADVVVTAPAAPPWPQLAGRTAALSLDGDFAALALALDAPGEPALRGEVTLDLLAAQPAFDAQLALDAGAPLTLADYADLPATLRGIALLPPVSVAASGNTARQTLTATGELREPRAGVVAFGASARHDGGRLGIDRLILRRPDSADELRIAGDLSWREGLTWSLAVSSPGLTLPETSVPVSGRLAGSFSSTGTLQDGVQRIAVGDIDLRGEVNGARARIEGGIALADGALAADSELRAQLPGAVLTLRPASDAPGVSMLSVHVAKLGAWHPAAAGELRLDGRIDSDGRSSLSGDLSHLGWGDLRAASGSLAGSYDAARGGRFDLRLNLETVQTPAGRLDTLALTAAGDRARLAVELVGSGAIAGELALEARRGDAGWTGELAPTALDIAGFTWHLETPVALSRPDGDAIRVAAHCWQQTHARLCAGDWTLAARGAGSARLTAHAQFFARWLPAQTELQGSLNTELAVAWSEVEGATAHLTGEAGPVHLTLALPEDEQREAHWRHLAFDARYREGALELAASLANGPRPEFALALRLPARREQPLSGSLHIDGLDLAEFTGLSVLLGGLEGRVDGDLRLAGTAARPLLYGGLQLENGRLLLSGYPTAVERLALRLDAQGDRASLSGRGLLGGGELALDGELLAAPEPGLTLSLRGRDNLILYPPSAELRTSSDLVVTAGAEQLSVTGEITVHDGVFEYTQLPDHGVGLSGDVVRVNSAGRAQTEDPPLAVALDVRVRVEEAFRLRGPQLEAGLSGRLQLRSRPSQPLQIFGSLNTAGGHATAFERTLEIKRGVISFTGAPDNPMLDLRAERRISGGSIIAGVHVHGALATDLSLDVYSEPPMSQSEAMSYLIWGRGLTSGTGGDGTVLALSLAGSVVNRSSLVSAINQVPGIDNVSFGAEGGEEDAAATVSGFVGQRLYLAYGVGLYEPINVLTARFFLQTRLWLEVVSRLENSVDLYYSFDID